MTTHYIEEAERLCDRVAIVDEGRIIALDTPARLQQQSRNASSIVVTCATPFPGESSRVGGGDAERARHQRTDAHRALAASGGHAGGSGEVDRSARSGADRRQPEAAQPGRCFHRTDRKEPARVKAANESLQGTHRDRPEAGSAQAVCHFLQLPFSADFLFYFWAGDARRARRRHDDCDLHGARSSGSSAMACSARAFAPCRSAKPTFCAATKSRRSRPRRCSSRRS